MKLITIAGRVGKPGELRRTQDGDPVLSFSVATDDGWGERKSTMWFDCSLWGKRAMSLEPHLNKGTAVTVIGDLGRREHDGKTYLTVRVNEIELQGSSSLPKGAADTSSRQQSYGEQSGGSYGGGARDLDDEIPFEMSWK